jgi:two-component system response regulator GlrR
MQSFRGAMYENALGRRPGQRILLADDDPDSLEGLRALLEAWGYEVEIARDGQAALDQVPVVRPSVVITDVIMPRMTGLELLEAIRRDRPTIPVIVMTAHGSVEARRHAAAMGAVAYLPKPIDTTRLKSALVSAFLGAKGDADS